MVFNKIVDSFVHVCKIVGNSFNGKGPLVKSVIYHIFIFGSIMFFIDYHNDVQFEYSKNLYKIQRMNLVPRR